MPGTTVTLRHDNGDSDVDTIQHAVDQVLRACRERPPSPDGCGGLLLDLSTLTGQPPIDLCAVARGVLADLDLTGVRVEVRTEGQGLGGLGIGIVATVTFAAGTGSVELARRSEGLLAFWREVVLPAVHRLVSRDAVGALRSHTVAPPVPAAPVPVSPVPVSPPVPGGAAASGLDDRR